MYLPKHMSLLMATVVSFSIAASPVAPIAAFAQTAPAASAPGDTGWQKEFELWRTSNKGGKAEDYQKYLRVYPTGKFANVAKRRIEELTAAAPVKQDDQTAAVVAGAKNVPAEEASADTAKDVEMWRQVSKTGKQADYEKYLKEFPNGKFAKVAKTRIENLLAAVADTTTKVEVTAKKLPVAEDTAAAADVTQEQAPAEGNAVVIDNSTKTEQPAGSDWEQEYALWKAASDGNTVNEYEAYLKAYPAGKFAAIAQARVVQLAAAEQPDPLVSEGDNAQSDTNGNANKVVGKQQEEAVQPEDDQGQDTTADQGNVEENQDVASANPNNKQNTAGNQQGAQYTEGSEDIEDGVLDREQRHEMQGRLSALGYDTQGTDGAFGPRTRDAIASWQQDNGAPVSGYLSEDQIDAIRVASVAAYASWLATAAPVIIRRVRPRTEWVMVRPRNNFVVVKRRPVGVVVVKPFRNGGRFNNRVKFKVKFGGGGCRKKRRC